MASGVDQCFQGLLNWRRQWQENVWRGIHRWHTVQNVFRGGHLTPLSLTRLRWTCHCQGKGVQMFLRKAVPVGRRWTICVNLTLLRTVCCTGCVPVWLWYYTGDPQAIQLWNMNFCYVVWHFVQHGQALSYVAAFGLARTRSRWAILSTLLFPYIYIYCLASSFKFNLLKTLTDSLLVYAGLLWCFH